MTFSYDPNLADDTSWIRLQTGDSVSGTGPRADGSNFSDEEIAALLGLASNDTQKVVAELFSILAAEWTRLAISYTIGPRKEELWRVVDLYTKKYQQWAVVAGIASTSFASGTYRSTRNGADAGVT